MTILSQSVRELYRTFVAQGTTVVYGTVCCGRIYLGLNPASKCRTCIKTPKSIKIESESDLDTLAS